MTGIIVRSKAGHDKGQLFVISGVSDEKGGCVYIVNGKTRRIENPKKKKPKHLIFTDELMDTEKNFTDKTVRKKLNGLKASLI